MKKNIFLFLLLGLGSCHTKEIERTGLEGKLLPSFKITLADSVSSLSTASIPGGRPSVFFYFGPFCPYSRAQMEDILSHMKTLKNIQFYVFTTWPFADMKQFYRYYQLSKYPNIITGIDSSGFFPNYFKAQGVPYLAVYGKDKRLIQAFPGKTSTDELLKTAME